MPRKARVLLPGCPHHIVQRGHNRRALFVDACDYQYYLSNLREWKERLGLRIYAWCLMTNHIHLILEPQGDVSTVSVLMKRINGRQTAYVNRLEGRTGTLWEGRYKASPIQRGEYLLACLRYIELNPVRAGMVTSAEDYPWSSFRERAQPEREPMLDLDSCFLALGADGESRMHTYRRYLDQPVGEEELRVIRSGARRNQLTGNDRFVEEVEERLELRIEMRGRGRPRKHKK